MAGFIPAMTIKWIASLREHVPGQRKR